LKQLIQIPTYSYNNVGASITSTMSIPPWHYSNATIQVGASTTPFAVGVSYTGTDISCANLAYMYCFARGSSDIHVYSANTGCLFSVDQLAGPFQSGAPVAPTAYNQYGNLASTPKVLTNGDAPIHCRIPAYQNIVRYPVNGDSGFNFTRQMGNNPALFDPFLAHYSRLKVVNTQSSPAFFYIGYSAGDDATLAAFKGPPPVMVPNTAGTNPLHPSNT